MSVDAINRMFSPFATLAFYASNNLCQNISQAGNDPHLSFPLLVIEHINTSKCCEGSKTYYRIFSQVYDDH